MGKVEIRPLEAKDAEEFSALRRAVTADNPVPMGLSMDEELTRPLEGFRDQLSSPAPNAAFGAFVDGVLQGCAALAWTSRFESSRHKALLWGTFVAPNHRGQGIARMVVGRAIEHGRNNALQRINLMVYIPNVPAVALYEGFGFTPYGVEPKAVFLNGQYYDGQHMTLALGETAATA
ncbi:GNAT family N-acetyltransferase [Ottowia thiooxydans]|uniref:RimJ/RimL family protein N-acetyltransferase n=1 Tax=Ottowia thiooxydans TaxID=219182 RepID=A0ABV2QAT0_9BURK